MDDAALLKAFEAQAIPLEEWKHRHHVRVAWIYASRHPFGEALRRMREGILALNAANGIAATPEGGYHVTLTIAWMRIVAAAAQTPARDSRDFLVQHPELASPRHILRYYSVDHVVSEPARLGWVEPDLEPLPSAPANPPSHPSSTDVNTPAPPAPDG
ncbi:MAG: hypothetical protein H6739_16320 [Alphaproteobacteria bacterium]|nr:hypothetical protein [Alphaproteobacteria bacterium]